MRLGVGLAAVVGLMCVAWMSGSASQAKVTGYPNKQSAMPLARAMERNKGLVRRAFYSTVPPFSKPTAVSTTRMAGFPTRGKSFAILSTGDARLAETSNNSANTGVSIGGPSIRGARDVTIIRLDLRVPVGDNCLSFDFRFLTEEFPEIIGDIYNDAFIAELGRSNWNARSKVDPVVRSPANFATSTRGNPIRVNTVGFTGMTSARARGTTYDGGTRKLRASTRIKSGQRKLYLSIFDQGDRVYDSAVFLDNLRTSRAKECRTGVRAAN